MKTDNELRERLLGQMDRDAGATPGASRQAAQAVLAKDAKHLGRLRLFTVVSWVVFAAACLASAISGALTGFKSEAWIIATVIGVQAPLIAAAALTVALSFRSRTLRMKEIQAALADLQEQLKSLSEKKTGSD